MFCVWGTRSTWNLGGETADMITNDYTQSPLYVQFKWDKASPITAVHVSGSVCVCVLQFKLVFLWSIKCFIHRHFQSRQEGSSDSVSKAVLQDVGQQRLRPVTSQTSAALFVCSRINTEGFMVTV